MFKVSKFTKDLFIKRLYKKTIKFKYFYDSTLPNVCTADVEVDEHGFILSQDIFDTLAKDKINLRKIDNIRYYNDKVDAFVLLEDEGLDVNKIENSIVTLKLEKSSSKSSKFLFFLFK
jgi:hypothetical protein